MAIGIGAALREGREASGRSIDDAARYTRVRHEYLLALEEERFGALGGDVYAKGFLTTYARFLGIDPQPLLELYRAEVQGSDLGAQTLAGIPVGRPPRGTPPVWLVWPVAAILLLVIVLALAGSLGGRVPEPVAAPEFDPDVSVTPTQSEEPEPEPTPTPSPSPTAVNLVLLLEERSWMQVRVSGQNVFEGILDGGESKEFTASDEVFLHLGNAGGVRLVLNGEDLGSPADRGAVWKGSCTPEGCSEVTA